MVGVNALSRALSISTVRNMMGAQGVRVSMPLVGLYPFLRLQIRARHATMACVNALSRALSISTEVIL